MHCRLATAITSRETRRPASSHLPVSYRVAFRPRLSRLLDRPLILAPTLQSCFVHLLASSPTAASCHCAITARTDVDCSQHRIATDSTHPCREQTAAAGALVTLAHWPDPRKFPVSPSSPTLLVLSCHCTLYNRTHSLYQLVLFLSQRKPDCKHRASSAAHFFTKKSRSKENISFVLKRENSFSPLRFISPVVLETPQLSCIWKRRKVPLPPPLFQKECTYQQLSRLLPVVAFFCVCMRILLLLVVVVLPAVFSWGRAYCSPPHSSLFAFFAVTFYFLEDSTMAIPGANTEDGLHKGIFCTSCPNLGFNTVIVDTAASAPGT